MNERFLLGLETAGMIAGIILTAWIAPQTMAAHGMSLFCLLYATHRFAPLFLPRHAPGPRLFIMLIVLLGLQSILQTITYYLSIPLTGWTDAGTQSLSLVITALFAAWQQIPTFSIENPVLQEETSTKFKRPLPPILKSISRLSILLPALIAATFIIFFAHQSATTAAIRTPWAILPNGTLLAFACLFSAGWLMAWRGRSVTRSWLTVAIFLIVIALITPLLYPIGFGFDGFLHRASEDILFQTGSLTPKPFYYIGQYSFITWLARTLTLPLHSLDTILLSTLVALLPASMALASNKKLRTEWISIGFIGLVLFFPLQTLITTTPQSLAYIIGFSGLLLSLYVKDTDSFLPSFILGGWALAIHPLAGLPIFGAIMLMNVRQALRSFPKWRLGLSSVIALGIALIIPFAFFINSRFAGIQIEWHFGNILPIQGMRELMQLFLAPPLRIAWGADWAAFVDYFSPLLLAILALLGIWKKREADHSHSEPSRAFAWLAVSGLLTILVAWVMQHSATFTFLIEYERQDYTQRVFLIGSLLLIPAAAAGFVRLWVNIKKQPSLTFFSFILLLVAWQTARIYRAFPYHDATHIEHGWNTSADDFEAVRWIEHDSLGQPYTVLANQSVSAAAIAELGFKRYAGQIFFYPIPTGGPLYQVFLRTSGLAVTQADIDEASRLGQTTRVYVVINNYWWQADKVRERLTTLAGNEYSIDKGAVTIYRFGVNNAKNR